MINERMPNLERCIGCGRKVDDLRAKFVEHGRRGNLVMVCATCMDDVRTHYSAWLAYWDRKDRHNDQWGNGQGHPAVRDAQGV
jgi:hypothetical protein